MRILALVLLAGCSMYGAPADRLHLVPPIHRPATVVAPIVYNESCTVDFHRKPQGVQRHGEMAAARIAQGDTTIAAATKAATDTARVDLIVSGIAHYSAALLDDPFDAQATLKLAIAYDKALHKGCALALLHRLDALAQNPKLAPEASARIDDVVDNPQWFRDYRKDALAAVNR
jgi:LPS sulfotransferase NodH